MRILNSESAMLQLSTVVNLLRSRHRTLLPCVCVTTLTRQFTLTVHSMQIQQHALCFLLGAS